MTNIKSTKVEKTDKAETKVEKPDYYYAIGRRKEATARVRLYLVTDERGVVVNGMTLTRGQIVVNGRPVEQYFPGEAYKKMYMEPLRTTNAANRFAASVKVEGGGLVGQLGAMVLGLSRALEKVDKVKNRPILKKRGFLTRDSRIKQRRKAGYAQKARKKKQSPKR